jgi:hypothetical protein
MTDELLDLAITTTGGARCGTARRGLNIEVSIGAPIRAMAHRCAED